MLTEKGYSDKHRSSSMTYYTEQDESSTNNGEVSQKLSAKMAQMNEKFNNYLMSSQQGVHSSESWTITKEKESKEAQEKAKLIVLDRM